MEFCISPPTKKKPLLALLMSFLLMVLTYHPLFAKEWWNHSLYPVLCLDFFSVKCWLFSCLNILKNVLLYNSPALNLNLEIEVIKLFILKQEKNKWLVWKMLQSFLDSWDGTFMYLQGHKSKRVAFDFLSISHFIISFSCCLLGTGTIHQSPGSQICRSYLALLNLTLFLIWLMFLYQVRWINRNLLMLIRNMSFENNQWVLSWLA